jgi:hypothetical protein
VTEYLSQIRAVCGHDNYPEARQVAEEEYQTASKDSADIFSASSMYEKFKTKFMANKCCALCARGFDDSEEEAQFLQRVCGVVYCCVLSYLQSNSWNGSCLKSPMLFVYEPKIWKRQK